MKHHILSMLGIVFLLQIALALPAATAQESQTFDFAADEIMPLSEVKAGMTGYGKTVFKGTEIERFDIEVIGIVENYYPKKDVIVVRVDHPVTDLAKVIHGMSGSPIYINDKMIGALAYKFSALPMEPIAGVTPIEYMLEIEGHHEESSESAGEDYSRNRIGQFDTFFDKLWNYMEDEQQAPFDMNLLLPEQTTRMFSPISTPLTISGLDPVLFDQFSDVFSHFGFTPMMGGMSGDSGDEPINLAPGSVVAATLISGDMNVGATGTVTYRDNDKILAFGHPFLGIGLVDVPMSQGEVVTVIADQNRSYKMSNTTSMVGSVIQDDTHGIFGRLGLGSPMIQTTLNYHVDGEPVTTFNYEMLRDENWTPFLMFMAFLNSFSSTGSMGGDRTLELDATLSFKNYEDVVINDRFAGQGSEFSSSILILQALGMLMGNDFIFPELTKIELDVNVVDRIESAAIEQIWYSQQSINPGDTLDVTLFIRPRRADTFVKKVSLPVPESIGKQGMALVQVGSGSMMDMFDRMFSPARYQPEDMGQLIELLNDRRTNENLYVRLLWRDQGAVVEGEEMPALPPSVQRVFNSRQVQGATSRINDQELAELIIPIEYVVSGSHNKVFRVSKNNTLQ